MKNYSVDIGHEKIMATRCPELSFWEELEYEAWRNEVKEKLIELLGDMPERVEANLCVEEEKDRGDFMEYRMIFSSEEEVEVPCHLWIPKAVKKPCPVVICLQGHSTGMHISMGRAIYPGDDELISGGDRDFARQIVKEGYAALVLEQRGFGSRKSERELRVRPDAACTCAHPAMIAMLMGRTLIGERVWDISRAIDILENFSGIDTERVAVMGNSGGGTAAYYAACMDERIKIAMPSCAVCTYKGFITAKRHCPCNYIPGIAKYLDMGDLACLIAPRKLIVVAGELDNGFFIDGVREAYETIEKIYAKAGVPEACRLVVGSEGHRFYAEPSWKIFKDMSGWEENCG